MSLRGPDGSLMQMSNGRIWVDAGMAALISNNNSSTTSLGPSGVFTGTGEDVANYGNITVAVYSTVAGSFTVQWSHNNSTWLADGDTYSVTSSVLKSISYGPKAQYFRIVFTNGGSPATNLIIQTILRAGHTKPSSHMVAEAINDSADAELVKAVLTGRRSNGTYTNVEISNNADMCVADICDAGGSSAAITVGTSSLIANVSGVTNLTNRKCLTIYNNGTVLIYWGLSSGVTTSSGTPIVPGTTAVFAAGPNTSIYLISGTASQNVRITEMA